MKKAGAILILIIFIIESFFIIPLLWTIIGIKKVNKINRGESTSNDEIVVAILGIIFGFVLGLIGGILILVGQQADQNKTLENPKVTNS